MSIFLEFPSIEDYPVYSKSTDEIEKGLLPAEAFNWLLTLQFSALRSPEVLSFETAQTAGELVSPE